MGLTPLAASYDHVLLDLDGCVWVGDEPTERAGEAIAALRAAGKGLAFITNDGRSSPEEHVRKLWRLGFQASLEEVVTVGAAMQFHLAEHYGAARSAAIVVGSAALHRHVEQAGLRIVNRTAFASRAEVVVVGAHDLFDYEELREATQAALRGASVVTAGRDATFPMPDGPWPGTGAVVAAIEAAAGVVAENVGKPSAPIVQTALDRLGPGRALMVGDRIDADIGAAKSAGIDGALVLTGATAPLPAHRAEGAVVVRDSLADLVLAG